MNTFTDHVRRSGRRALAIALTASLLWAGSFAPAEADDPSAPPEETTAVTEVPIADQGPTPDVTVTSADPAPADTVIEEQSTGERSEAVARPRPRVRSARTGEAAQSTEERVTITAAAADQAAVDSIYGWVWDDFSYDDLRGIDVTVYRENSQEVAATAVTDWSGFYFIQDLPAGNYQVYFAGNGFFPEWSDDKRDRWEAATVSVVEGSETEVSAKLGRRASITVTVTDSAKKPVANRWIPLWFDDGGEYLSEVDGAYTDSKGRAVFTDLPVGFYDVDNSELPKNARMKVEATYAYLASYSGKKFGGWLTPWVKGEPSTGSTLTADRGSGKWKDTTFSYQWLRDGMAISGATKSTYKPGLADRDHQLQVRITSRHGNNTFTAISPTSWWITLVAVPTVSGSLAVGSTVTANEGRWDEYVTFKQYQWYANGKAISGATKRSLLLTSSHKGKKITVKVVGRIELYPSDYPDLSRTSAATAKVTTAGTPTITGAMAVGSTLKAKPGSWTKKTKFTYQWLRDGAKISKATKSSYKLTKADAGKLITVQVTGKLSGYATVAKTSQNTVKAMAAATPAISGTAATGSILTARPGTWTTGTTFSYQWYANGKAISGGTQETLLVAGSQAGRKITVKVTGTLSGHATVAKTSKATAKVLSVGTVTTSGAMLVGSTLKAKPGSWTKKTKFTYQWLRNGVKISKATKSSYELTSADLGTTVTVRVTGKLSGYGTASSDSAGTGLVTAP